MQSSQRTKNFNICLEWKLCNWGLDSMLQLILSKSFVSDIEKHTQKSYSHSCQDLTKE